MNVRKQLRKSAERKLITLKANLLHYFSLKTLGMSLVTSKRINHAKKKLHDQEMLLKSKNFNMFFVDYQYKRAL